MGLLGHAYLLSGRVADALPLIGRARDLLTTRGWIQDGPRLASGLAEDYLLTGQTGEAIRLAAHALDRAATYRERGHQAWALRVLREIAARREPPESDEAERRYQGALALAEELGMRPLQAHCHLGLCRLYRTTGRQDDARIELATAITMLREMDMTFWLPEAEAEQAQLTGVRSETRAGGWVAARSCSPAGV